METKQLGTELLFKHLYIFYLYKISHIFHVTSSTPDMFVMPDCVFYA